MTSRRTVVQGMAAAGVAVPLLAACGASTAAPPKAGEVPASDIPVGGGKLFEDKGFVVTQPTKGQFKAFSSTCTHAGCTVDNPQGGIIECRCHGSEFSIADGSVKRGPAQQPLPAVDVTVVGNQLRVG